MQVNPGLQVALSFAAFFLIAFGGSWLLDYGFNNLHTSDTVGLVGAALVALGATILWHQKTK